MSFWTDENGEDITNTGDEYEIPSGDLDPIPNGSSVLAMIDEAKWDKRGEGMDEAKFVSIRWSVVAPDEYKNRKIFQKLWVTDDDPNAEDAEKAAKKRTRQRKMLVAIDANSGRGLPKDRAPTDEEMAINLCGKPMIIKCMEYDFPSRENPNERIVGNWISKVAPASKGVDVKPPKDRAQTQAAPGSAAMDDKIPF